MKAPLLGTAKGRSVRFDLAKLLAWRLLIQASSGGGKSYTVRSILEVTDKLVQRVVIDVDGDYATLREKFDFVVVGGEDSDYPVSVAGIPTLVRAIVETNASFILDISGLPATEHKRTNGENRFAFVGQFLEALMALPRADWRSMLVVVDEAHVFAPERGKEPSSLYGMVMLASQGRKRGFAAVYATQRISKIHKDAIADLRNRMVGLTVEGIDQDRVADEWGFRKNEKQALETFEPGHFWVKGPAFGSAPKMVQIRHAETMHPEPGKPIPPVPAPSDSLQKILAKLKEIPKKRKEEAETLASLKEQIQALKKELQMATKKIQVEVEVEERFVFRKGEVEKVAKAVDKLDRYIKSKAALIEQESNVLRAATAELGRLQACLAGAQGKPAPRPIAVQKRTETPKAAAPAGPAPELGDLSGVKGRHEVVLSAMGLYRIEKLEVDTLAALSRYAPESRPFLDILRLLRSEGVIFYEGGRAWLTGDGEGKYLHLLSGRPASDWSLLEHLAHWRNLLKPRFFDVLDALPSDGGDVKLEDLAGSVSYAHDSRPFLDILRHLKRIGLINYGNARASFTPFMLRNAA